MHVRAEPHSIEQLALAIDAMDSSLGRFKARQASAMQSLQAEQSALEQDLEALASRLESELAAEQRKASGVGSSSGAAAAATGHKVVKPVRCVCYVAPYLHGGRNSLQVLMFRLCT